MRASLGPPDQEEQSVALALGLKDRQETGYTPYAELQSRIEEMLQQTLLRLDEWLADPEAILDDTDLALLRRHAEWLTPHAETLANRYQRFSVDRATTGRAIWPVTALLLALNDADLAWVTDRLHSTYWDEQRGIPTGPIKTLNDRICAMSGPLACEYVWPKAPQRH